MASDRYLGDGIRKAPFLIPQERGNVGPNGALGRNHLLHGRRTQGCVQRGFGGRCNKSFKKYLARTQVEVPQESQGSNQKAQVPPHCRFHRAG